MNKFGGDWTENKIEILVEYAKAYLTIMNIFEELRDLFRGEREIESQNWLTKRVESVCLAVWRSYGLCHRRPDSRAFSLRGHRGCGSSSVRIPGSSAGPAAAGAGERILEE